MGLSWTTHRIRNRQETQHKRYAHYTNHYLLNSSSSLGPDDVKAMGIDKYNEECRQIVMRYAGEWETTVNRMGRWIDFKNDYKTLNTSFMESVIL